MSEIKYLSIEKIIPNPLNPRKDLGDLSELSESIKSKGVLQNLTVVPDGENYVLVIGHRRHAASKIAGLTELPCVIKELTEKEQAQIMLMENIQRNELTIYEQAQGFQMMIDLGASVTEVAKETGFSETTVRHRLKLNELDPELLKEKSAKPISIADYIKLEQIKDPELKNEALKQIGTTNFDWYVQNMVQKEVANEVWAKTIERLKPQAFEIDEIFDGLKVDDYIYKYNMKEGYEYKFRNEDEEHFFKVDERCITIYVNDESCEPVEETEEEKAEREAKERKKEIKAKLDEVKTTAYNLRVDFMKSVSDAKCKTAFPQIVAIYLRTTFLEMNRTTTSFFGELTGLKNPNKFSAWESEYKEIFKTHLDETVPGKEYRMLAVKAYSAIENQYAQPYDGDGVFIGKGELDKVYGFLNALGYEMSEEEQKFIDGTHELYEE